MLDGAGVVLALDVQRARLTPAGQPHRPPAGDVMAHLADGADRVVQRKVAERHPRFDHFQHQRRGAHLEHCGGLAHVGVADDDVQPPVLLGVGVRLVASVDDRPAAGGRRGNAFPNVLGTLAQAEGCRLGGLQHLAGPADQLAGDQEGKQHVGDPGKLAGPHDQVVLVAAVGVARRVGVVLEQIDVAADAFVGKPLLGVDEQVFEHPFAGPVVGDQLHQAVAFGGGVLGMTAHVEVEAGPVTQEHI